MTAARYFQLFRKLHADVNHVCGPLCLTPAMEDDRGFFPAERSYAYFRASAPEVLGRNGGGIIVMSTKIFGCSEDRCAALIMHEFGHAMDFLARPPPLVPARVRNDPSVHKQGGERRADALAEAVWGIPIRYDLELVQSLTCGVCPRPTFLGL